MKINAERKMGNFSCMDLQSALRCFECRSQGPLSTMIMMTMMTMMIMMIMVLVLVVSAVVSAVVLA